MKITWSGIRFELDLSSITDKNKLQEAYLHFHDQQFHWDKHDKVWFTVDPSTVKKHYVYLDRGAETKMYQLLAEEKETYAASMLLEADFDPPCPEKKRYFRYQKACGIFLQKRLFRPTLEDRTGILIGDEMGVGKTMEATLVANMLMEQLKSKAPRILIVCEGHLRKMWAEIMGSWLLEEHGVAIATSKCWPTYAQVVVCSYDTLKSHYDAMRAMPWDLWISDEVHKACNYRTDRTQNMFGNTKDMIAIPARYAVFLSGTPFRNRPIELYPMLHYLDPLRWPSVIDFGIRYCDGFQTKSGKWNFQGESNLDELQVKLRSTVMIRRLKKDVMPNLPPKTRQVVELPAGEDSVHAITEELDAWKSYQSQIEAAKKLVEDAKAIDDEGEYKLAMKKLRYTVSIAFNQISKFRHKTAIAKIPYILTQIEEAITNVGPKVIVFAHHHDVIDAICSKYPNYAACYGGKYQVRDPYEEQQRFQTDPNVGPFVCSLRKSTGLTLTASCTEIFAELDWVAANMLQSEDRAHRYGQTRGLQILILVLAASLDANLCHKIVAKLEKYDLALNTSPSEELRQAYIANMKDDEFDMDVDIVTSEPVPEFHEVVEPLALIA